MINFIMASEENKNPYKGVTSMFLSGTVTKMKDIEDLYPTNIAKALKINHSRYIDKLRNPGKFSFEHIWKLSQLLEIDIQLIIDIIKKELETSAKVSKKKSS